MTYPIMTPAELTEALERAPVEFTKVIACIDHYYSFTPVAFQNGSVKNDVGTNLGSCKIFAFAQRHHLSELATLNAFGAYYTHDVLLHPDATDHQNIRSFMQHGWQGVTFQSDPLAAKQDV